MKCSDKPLAGLCGIFLQPSSLHSNIFSAGPCWESLCASSMYAKSFPGVVFQLSRKLSCIQPEPLTFPLH